MTVASRRASANWLVSSVVAAGFLYGSSGNAADWTIGAGAGVAPDYEGSDDYEAVPLWSLRVDNLYAPDTFVQVLQTRLRSNLLADPHLRLGVSGLYLFERHDVENNAVDRLNDTDPMLLLGGLLGWDFDPAPARDVVLEVDAKYDVLHGNGGNVTLRGLYGGPIAEGWRLGIEVSSTWASEDFMSERFGISNAESIRSGLDSFDAGAGIKDASAVTSLTYQVTQSILLTGSLAYSRLLGDAADSPIVDDEGDANQWVAGLVASYRF